MRRPHLGFRMISMECGLDSGDLAVVGVLVRGEESGVRIVAERDERKKWIKRGIGRMWACCTHSVLWKSIKEQPTSQPR